MAAGVPVVSTARGAEGLAIAPGTHYILADRDTEMSAAVVDLAGDGAKRECLAAAAAALVRQKYDWSVLGDRLAAGLLSLF
jgi:glycosyltransferase involved in cell wall biosynthesis